MSAAVELGRPAGNGEANALLGPSSAPVADNSWGATFRRAASVAAATLKATVVTAAGSALPIYVARTAIQTLGATSAFASVMPGVVTGMWGTAFGTFASIIYTHGSVHKGRSMKAAPMLSAVTGSLIAATAASSAIATTVFPLAVRTASVFGVGLPVAAALFLTINLALSREPQAISNGEISDALLTAPLASFVATTTTAMAAASGRAFDPQFNNELLPALMGIFAAALGLSLKNACGVVLPPRG